MFTRPSFESGAQKLTGSFACLQDHPDPRLGLPDEPRAPVDARLVYLFDGLPDDDASGDADDNVDSQHVDYN